MPDQLEHQLDALAPTADTPPLPDAIATRTRTIRRQRAITHTALLASPMLIAIAAASWIALSNQPAGSPELPPQIATTEQPVVIPLTEATPANLMRINKDRDPENLILPQVYTHTTTTPVPTPAAAIRTERSDPPSQ